ncbi:MAG: 50S ribosomal protein L18 [bacterium]|nr:50S ribosomal protein L18 [bacterium]
MSKENVSFKKLKKDARHLKIRAKIKGTAEVPRLAVFRSNAHIYAQLIDDESGKTLLSVSDKEIKTARAKSSGKDDKGENGRRIAVAKQVGLLAAEKAKKAKIEKVVFDRGGFKYHGRIKSIAEGAREGGMKF